MEGVTTYTLLEMKDKYLGKKGTAERDVYEHALKMELCNKK